MNAQYVSSSSLVINFTHAGDDTNMRQYLVINIRRHHIGHDLRTVKKKYSIELFISQNLAMSYDHH